MQQSGDVGEVGEIECRLPIYVLSHALIIFQWRYLPLIILICLCLCSLVTIFVCDQLLPQFLVLSLFQAQFRTDLISPDEEWTESH